MVKLLFAFLQLQMRVWRFHRNVNRLHGPFHVPWSIRSSTVFHGILLSILVISVI